MRVSIYSRKEIENIIVKGEFPEKTAVISFYDPAIKHIDKDYTHVDYSRVCSNVYYCEVEDLDRDYLSEKGYTYETFFPDADKVAEFICQAYNNCMDIICQCDYGQSRSAGCAAAILQHFYKTGIDIFIDYNRYPNQVIYHKIFDALEKQNNKITLDNKERLKILNIHGYRGSENNNLYQALHETGYDVVTLSIDYDKLSPEEVMSLLNSIIERENIYGVAGTSLGGFFAMCCSAVHNIPALLVNPALLPEVLLPELGYKRLSGIREFTRVRACLANFQPGLLTTIIGDEDEVISDKAVKEYTRGIVCGRRIITVPGGGHSGSTLQLASLLIESDLLKEGRWLDVVNAKDETLR